MKLDVINSFTVVGFSIVLLLLLSAAALHRGADTSATRLAGMVCDTPYCTHHPSELSFGVLLR